MSSGRQSLVPKANSPGTNFAESVPTEDIDTEFVIVESSDLSDVQDVLGLLDALSWITAILALALLLPPCCSPRTVGSGSDEPASRSWRR